MKLHRFYAGELHDKYGPTELRQHVWVHDKQLYNQWKNVLRFREGQELVLFNGEGEDKLYRITTVEEGAFGLDVVTELVPHLPEREIYLFWSLLKKDKNEWVLQKCTELGVSHFVPILSERTEKTGFDEERARKIVIEASEQCGRSNIPRVREPMNLETALQEFHGTLQLVYGEQRHPEQNASTPNALQNKEPVGVFVGPEGGWTEQEKAMLAEKAEQVSTAQFTLRAETACVTVVQALL